MYFKVGWGSASTENTKNTKVQDPEILKVSIPKFQYYQISKIVNTKILIDLQDFLKIPNFFINNLKAKEMFRILLEFFGILKPENC